MNQYDPIVIIEQGYEAGLHHDLGSLNILLKAKVPRQVAGDGDIGRIFRIPFEERSRIFRKLTILYFYYSEIAQLVPILRAVDEDHSGREDCNYSDPLSLKDVSPNNTNIRVLDDFSDLLDSLGDARIFAPLLERPF